MKLQIEHWTYPDQLNTSVEHDAYKAHFEEDLTGAWVWEGQTWGEREDAYQEAQDYLRQRREQ